MPVGVRTTLHGDRLHLRAVFFGPEAEPPKTAGAEGPATTPEAVAAELFARLQISGAARKSG